MACYVNKVVATAIGEIGYKESGNNITKYAAYFDKNCPNFYNTKKQGAEYCDIFVDYCVMVNSADENEAEYVLCQPAKSCGAGCSFSYNYYKEKGRVGNEPKIGAQIFFGTGKKPSHTGIVVDVTADKVITVEGNSDNMVKKHTYTKKSARIFGYGYPRYSEDAPTPAPTPTPEKHGYTGEFPTLPSRGYFKKGDKGIEVRKLQNLLMWISPGCLPRFGVDGEYGNETYNAVKVCQSILGVTVDGLWGKKSQLAAREYKK